MAKSLQQKLRSRFLPEADATAEIVDLIRVAQEQARALMQGLHPVEVDAAGLTAALDQLASATERRSGIKCTFQCDHPVFVADNDVAIHMFRIAQEAVTNAVRHARAERIEIRLENGENGLTLQVSDDGIGIPGDLNGATGMGLRIMRHRAGTIAGRLDVRPGTTGGTIVTCTL
jgi:signal transduction histidine kinase